MSFADRLIHEVAIERATPGAVDDYNQPTDAWNVVATVACRIVPKSGVEVAQTNQQGPRSGAFRIFMLPTDVNEGDHLVRADRPEVYEIGFIAERSGAGLHHLELDATKVYP